MSNTEENAVSTNTFQKAIEEEKAKIPSKFQVNEVLFEWEADDRLSYSFSGGQKSSYALFVLLIGLYFIWVGQPIITITAGAVFFLLYVLFTVPAARINNAIEKAGIRTAGRLYLWDDIINFWVAERDGRTVLYFTTRLNFPTRVILLADSFKDTQKIVSTSVDYAPYMPLLQPQGYFERLFDGTYVQPDEFFRTVTIQDVIIAQEMQKSQEEKAKEVKSSAIVNAKTPVRKTRSSKASA